MRSFRKKSPDPEQAFEEIAERYLDALDSQRFADAEDAVLDVFALAEEHCEQNPSPALALTVRATHAEEVADWDAAESAYRKILALPGIDPVIEYKAHADLYGLYRILNRDGDAFHHARLATNAARRADSRVVLTMALRGEARCLLWRNEATDADPVIAEALSLLDDDRMYKKMRAGVLVVRAESAITKGNLSDAADDLDTASDLLNPLAGLSIAAGVHADLAHWWAVTARLRTELGDDEGAVAAWHEAVSKSKHVASLPHAEGPRTKLLLASMLKGLADGLKRDGRVDDARQVVAEREGVLNDAGIPTDAA